MQNQHIFKRQNIFSMTTYLWVWQESVIKCCSLCMNIADYDSVQSWTSSGNMSPLYALPCDYLGVLCSHINHWPPQATCLHCMLYLVIILEFCAAISITGLLMKFSHPVVLAPVFRIVMCICSNHTGNRHVHLQQSYWEWPLSSTMLS